MLTNRRPERSTALFITLLIVAFGLMTYDVSSDGGGAVSSLRSGARSLFAPLQNAADAVTRPIAETIDAVADVAGLRAENDQLRQQLDETRAQLAQSEAVFAENEELRNLLNIELPSELETVAARVQAGGTSNFDHSIVIDKGSSSGVGADMPVVNSRGLVGRTMSVSETSATVLLLTDPVHQIRVRVIGEAGRGVARGRGSSDLSLRIDNASGPVAEGNLVVTAAGRYPPDLLVGAVSRDAIAEGGVLVQSTIAAAVDFNDLDFVKVVLFTDSDALPAEPPPPGEDVDESEPEVAP